MEQNRQAKEARKQEKEANQQIRNALKRASLGITQQKQSIPQEASNAVEDNERTQDEIVVALPFTSEMPVPPQLPNQPNNETERQVHMNSACIAGSKRPSLVVESGLELVVSYRDSLHLKLVHHSAQPIADIAV